MNDQPIFVCDQLDGASLSSLLNTAEGNGKRQGKLAANRHRLVAGSYSSRGHGRLVYRVPAAQTAKQSNDKQPDYLVIARPVDAVDGNV